MGFLKDGKKIEEEFSKLFNNSSNSTTSEDINQHWDIKIETKIDVKSIKRISRNDIFPNENFHYVEIVNVNGKPGWLYGEADAFAFETFDYWIIVDKNDLQDFISKKVNKISVDSPDKALYCLYRRNERKDKITLVKTLDLMFIASQVIIKPSPTEHTPGDSIVDSIKEQQIINRNLKKK